MHALALLFLLLPQADDFQRRVRVDGRRVWADDRVLYEGPWAKADVLVRALPAGDGYPPWSHVVVVVDGQEKVRLPVKSLAAPVAWPPLRAEELRPVLKKTTETSGGKKTLVLLVATDKADFEIYRGAPGPARVERTPESFTVYLDEKPLYRVPKTARARLRAEDLLAAFNAERARARVPKVKLSSSLSRGADLHALYLAKNDTQGLSGHDEDPAGAGYTEEGARAGKRSVIGPFLAHETPMEALGSLMATLYHRVSMLQPALTEIGVGWAWRRDGLGYLVVDVGSTEGRVDAKAFPVVYPAPGQTDVPVEFGLGSRETPNPLPPGIDTAGYPVTLQFPERIGKIPDLAVALLDPSGAEVPCHLSTPDRPARADWPQDGVVCLIPKEKLLPSTTYHVQLSYRDSAPRRWSFTTAKR